MKKLKTLALIGALTIGGFTASGLFSANQASAATPDPVQRAFVIPDDWDYSTNFEIHHNTDFISELAVGTLRHGGKFDVTINVGGVSNGVVKLYRLDPNGSDYGDLQRYKTIYATNTGNHNSSRFTTPITTGFAPGTYVAVLKVGNSYYHGGTFQITK